MPSVTDSYLTDSDFLSVSQRQEKVGQIRHCRSTYDYTFFFESFLSSRNLCVASVQIMQNQLLKTSESFATVQGRNFVPKVGVPIFV